MMNLVRVDSLKEACKHNEGVNRYFYFICRDPNAAYNASFSGLSELARLIVEFTYE